MPPLSGVALLAYVLMFIGLIGSILPIVPGPVLILSGIILWAWGDGFSSISWPTLLFVGMLAVLAWGSDLILTALFSRRSGASWKAIAAAIVGGLVGGLLFGGWIPVIGTVIATVAGGVVGIIAFEYYDKRELRAALRASTGYVVAFLVSSALEAFLGISMILIFAWQAFFAPS